MLEGEGQGGIELTNQSMRKRRKKRIRARFQALLWTVSSAVCFINMMPNLHNSPENEFSSSTFYKESGPVTRPERTAPVPGLSLLHLAPPERKGQRGQGTSARVGGAGLGRASVAATAGHSCPVSQTAFPQQHMLLPSF